MVTDRGGEEGHVEAEPFPTVTTNISDNQQQTSKKGEKKHNVSEGLNGYSKTVQTAKPNGIGGVDDQSTTVTSFGG